MRCKCCDKPLSDKELRTKNRFGEYEDMCIKCLKLSFVPVEEDEEDEETSDSDLFDKYD